MKDDNDGKTSSRRSFLKLAAASAPAAVAATAISGSAANADTAAKQGESGVQDTAHTRAYLESTKF